MICIISFSKEMENNNINNTNRDHNFLNDLLMNYKSILIVDDSNIDNFVCKKILEIFGCKNVTIFNDDKKAIDFLNTISKKPDLIIVNIDMQLNCGFNLIDKLKEMGLDNDNTKIMATVSSGLYYTYQMAEERKLKVIEKPVTCNKLADFLMSDYHKN